MKKIKFNNKLKQIITKDHFNLREYKHKNKEKKISTIKKILKHMKDNDYQQNNLNIIRIINKKISSFINKSSK